MNDKINVNQPIYRLLPTKVEGFDSLAGLALDMRWSWNHGSEELWRKLDPQLWELTHNPWGLLQTVSRDRLERILADPAFRTKVNDIIQSRARAIARPAWFQQNHPKAPLTCVAYFSMEFMLSEALPIYSGGLGNVAGDQLKAASDLGVPVVGVGLLYSQGYFRQVIDKDGAQQALFPYNDPGQLPITPLRDASGEWLRFEIALPGYSVWLRAWQVWVGRVKLYLLDSNDAANIPAHRGITGELYGGGPELRFKQELLLGIGGWRLLTALGIKPEVCHLNEGHAAFAVLERARNYMQETAQPFEVALAVTRAGNLFTTHTAVAAGFDHFDSSLIKQYLGAYAEQELGITLRDLLALGRQNPDDSSESFNMAYLAIAKEIEVEGKKMYESLAEEATGKELAGAFSALAKDEQRHYDIFANLEQSMLIESIAGGSVYFDTARMFRAIWEEIRKDEEGLKVMNDAETGYRKALVLEKKSIEEYSKILSNVRYEFQKDIVRLIIEEEKHHVKIIESLIEFVHRPKEWLENAEIYHLDKY